LGAGVAVADGGLLKHSPDAARRQQRCFLAAVGAKHRAALRGGVGWRASVAAGMPRSSSPSSCLGWRDAAGVLRRLCILRSILLRPPSLPLAFRVTLLPCSCIINRRSTAAINGWFLHAAFMALRRCERAGGGKTCGSGVKAKVTAAVRGRRASAAATARKMAAGKQALYTPPATGICERLCSSLKLSWLAAFLLSAS